MSTIAKRNADLTARIERAARDLRDAPIVSNPYSADGPHSWFRDLWVVGDAERRWQQGFDAGFGPVLSADGLAEPSTLPNPVHGGLAEARERLFWHKKHAYRSGQRSMADAVLEKRDLTTAATAGGGFAPPQHIGDAFAAAVRARSALIEVLPTHPLPQHGMTIKTPRMSTGVSTEVQATQNVAATEVDIVEESVEAPVSTITGFQDLSQALLERAEPGMDLVLATELGRSIAEDLDSLLLTGSGSAPYLKGLLSVSGITAVTYTDASPTPAELLVKIAEAASRVATALGRDPDLVVWHPRREAWAVSTFGATFPQLQASIPYGMKFVSCPSITTLAGTGTNEDKIVILRSDELPVYLGPTNFRVASDYAGSGTLTARASSWQYCSSLFGRRPQAIGTVTGSGLAAWY